MILIYEIINEAKKAANVDSAMGILAKYDNNVLRQVLYYTYHPKAQWHISEFPKDYVKPDTLPGISLNQLGTELRKLYLFRKGDSTAEKLSPKKQNELLIQLLESLEPREAEVIIGIFKKDQGVKGLTYNFVKEAFPQMLP